MPEVLLCAPSADDRGPVRALRAVVLDGEDDPGGIADLLVGAAGGTRRMAVGGFIDGRLAWPGVDLRYPAAHGLAVDLAFDPRARGDEHDRRSREGGSGDGR